MNRITLKLNRDDYKEEIAQYTVAARDGLSIKLLDREWYIVEYSFDFNSNYYVIELSQATAYKQRRG